MKKIFLTCFIVLLAASCGFEPLYSQRKDKTLWYFSGKFDNSVTSEMSKIKVEPIEMRFGQQVRNELLDMMTPLGMPSSPKYRLYVDLQDKEVIQQALRRDITATRERVRYAVVYRLEADNNVLISGDSVVYVSYDILANPYSTTIAQKKTETDAAKIIANDVALRLGAYFHKELTNKGQIL